jgi:hypothetical protein
MGEDVTETFRQAKQEGVSFGSRRGLAVNIMEWKFRYSEYRSIRQINWSKMKCQSDGKGERSVSKKVKLRFACIFLFFLTLVPLEILAEEAEHSEKGGVHDHRHHLALFLGATHTDEEDEFSIGIDYEYRLKPILGVGGLVEYTGGVLETTVVAAALFIHPYDEWRLVLAPGFENEGSDNEFLFRAGVSYQFPVGKWTISPEFNVDFVDGEENLVYGLSFGWGF